MLELVQGVGARPADLAAVCRLAAARLASNPEQLTRQGVEGYSAMASTRGGFTVGERLALDRYRARPARTERAIEKRLTRRVRRN